MLMIPYVQYNVQLGTQLSVAAEYEGPIVVAAGTNIVIESMVGSLVWMYTGLKFCAFTIGPGFRACIPHAPNFAHLSYIGKNAIFFLCALRAASVFIHKHTFTSHFPHHVF